MYAGDIEKTMRGLPPHLELDRKLGETELDYLMINLRGACNYQCKKCFADSPPVKNAVIGLDKTLDIIREASEIGIRAVVIAGEGEPLMSPGLEKIIQLNANIGLITIVFTNGSCLTKEKAFFMKNHDCSLIISCDSLNKEIYESLSQCKEGHFDDLMENLRFYREIMADTVEIRNGIRIVRASINMALSLKAENELSEMLKFCGDDFLFICNTIAHSGSASDNWKELCGTADDYERLSKQAEEFSQTGGTSASHQNKCCAYLYNGLAIGSEGSVLPCAYTQNLSRVLGNISQMSLKEAIDVVRKFKACCFASFGSEPCIVRHQLYDEIVERSKCDNSEG